VNQVESNFAQAFKSPVAKPIVDILRRIRHMITPLSFHVQESRSMEFCGPEPDFLAAISGSQYDIHDRIPFKESISMENIVTFGRLCSLSIILSYSGRWMKRIRLVASPNNYPTVLKIFQGSFYKNQGILVFLVPYPDSLNH